ncbi:helix-turn-helix transcriptional regulator [Acetobacterium fimetarium]|nr:WYL domain-containing protein [Acetobacterium fimetarium]
MAKTKNTHAFQNDIKHYDNIRDILRFLYMYGSYSKEELVKNKLAKSISSFYDTKQRIENYIDGEFLQKHKSTEKGSGKKYRFMYDPFICPVNYLAETYQNCSYVIGDFIFYFCLMQAFTDSEFRQLPYEYVNDAEYGEIDDCMAFNHEFTLNELITTIQLVFDANQELLENCNQVLCNDEQSELIFTMPRVRARINELTDLGILIRTQKDRYRLADDIFQNFDANELQDIQLMTQYFYNCSVITVPGFYLSSTIAEYSQANFISETDAFFNKQENPVFFYKNHRLQNVIDDDITWAILDAIHNRNVIQYSYRNKSTESKTFTVLPIKVVIDLQYGRQYLFAYDYDFKGFNIQRIASISDIKPSKAVTANQKYEFASNAKEYKDIHVLYDEQYHAHMKNVWNIARSDSPSTVLIHFCFPADVYEKNLSRLRSTCHCGTITELRGNKVDYTSTVQCESELVPWIKSFGSFATVDKHMNPNLYDKMKSDWEEALKLYGTI